MRGPAAQRQTEAAARGLCAVSQDARVFLKIDSTLRGPIAGLVAGALSGSGKSVAVIAPAFPEQGRALHEGRVVVDGQPGASLTDALGMDGTALLGARFVSSAEDVERAVEHARMRGARRVVVDADTSDCLQSIAGAWRAHANWLLVGSGGLARQVAGPAALAPGATPVPSAAGPILVIAGSPAPMTAAQLERLRGPASVTTMVQAQCAAATRCRHPPHACSCCAPLRRPSATRASRLRPSPTRFSSGPKACAPAPWSWRAGRPRKSLRATRCGRRAPVGRVEPGRADWPPGRRSVGSATRRHQGRRLR